MGEHPRDTMDDLTEVSCPQALEKVNTIRLTKSTEVRSKTFTAVVIGAAAGAALMLMFWPLFAQWGSLFIVIGGGVTPFFMVGTVRDQTRQLRWRRAVNNMRSQKIEGKVFFPNSVHPENVTRLESLVMRP